MYFLYLVEVYLGTNWYKIPVYLAVFNINLIKIGLWYKFKFYGLGATFIVDQRREIWPVVVMTMIAQVVLKTIAKKMMILPLYH